MHVRGSARNETIFKVDHPAKAIVFSKAISFAKWSVGLKNFSCQKQEKKKETSTTLKSFCTKKMLEKTPNIPEMRQF